MRLLCLAVAVALLIPIDGLSTQQPPPIEPGTRVRITAPDCGLDQQAGTLQASRGDTLVLDTSECPLASVTRLDVSRGRKSYKWFGGGAGFVLGASLGFVGGVAYHNLEVSESDPAWSYAIAGGLIGGVVVGSIGYGVGSLIKTDRWKEVPLDRLRVSLAPQGDGFTLGFTFTF